MPLFRVWIFIARQHAMHTEHDIVLAISSVRPSVCPSHCGIVSKQMHVLSKSFHHLVGPHTLLALLALQNSKENSLSRGV